MKNVRAAAAKIIENVIGGRSLSDCLEPALAAIKETRDKAFVQAVCYGVCRFYTRLDAMLALLLEKPLREKDRDLHALLLIGLYQLHMMRVPPHAAVTETVNAVETLKKSWASRLINAVLRRYLREKETIEAPIKENAEAFYAHPAWWINKIKQDWPLHWKTILTANNEHPPFSLRINRQKISRETYLEKLKQVSLSAKIMEETCSGILLETPAAAETLPGFFEGEVSVQDGAAQFSAELLQLQASQYGLDACAAPGGKLTHMLEIQPDLYMTAIEKNAKRMEPIKENLRRLQMQARCICADAAKTSDWWDKQLFDRILLDAPCSASGVIRRHPDIKLLRRPDDIAALANEQLHLMEALWPLLKPGGLFLYATCSIFNEENVGVMSAFFSRHADALEEKIQLNAGQACKTGWQILPGEKHMDGFYYTLIRKI